MIRKLIPVSVSILLAAALLFGAHWTLASSATAPEKSAFIGADTCLAWRATAALRREWRGGQCQGQSLITATGAYTVYLPVMSRNYSPVEEFRGLWVTRFDWTRFGHTVATSDLDTIVDRAASAHFNALLFQVRGTADAYYSSALEPWAARLTGSITKTLGTDPGFDPLAYLITRAHQRGLQVHAYLNIFPTWLCGFGAPPTGTTPLHPFWTLSYSTTWSAWRVYDESGSPQSIATCADYLWATPALSLTRSHVVAVAADIVKRYDVDGLHLDLIRYPGSTYSFDPYTLQAYSDTLPTAPTLTIAGWRPAFQRAQIDAIVQQIYSATTALKPDLLVSAAVWPNYISGYNSYYQDSTGWLAKGIIDANMPMLYSSDVVHDLAAWITRAQGFIADSYGRYVFPGISTSYTDVNQIINRIEEARSLGANGVALFSYGDLNIYDYWDDLVNGPFAIPATIPKPAWKP